MPWRKMENRREKGSFRLTLIETGRSMQAIATIETRMVWMASAPNRRTLRHSAEVILC